MEVRLVEEYRGEMLENVHSGHICIVNDNRSVVYRAGNPNHVTYLRSSGKPFQAIPFFVNGTDRHYPFNEKELTILTASHRAEPFHVEALESIIAKTGLQEQSLVCHPTYPLNISASRTLIAAGSPQRKLYHNCSGKHLGVLALSFHKDYSLSDYWHEDHPVQREIIATLAMMAEIDQSLITLGTDGCGFPVFAMPLNHLATAYLKLACPDLIENKEVREAVTKLTRLMNRHPEMVSGTGLICSALNSDDNIVAKGGAKGVYCFALKKERLGIALKVLDGSEDEWPIIAASVLKQLGYDNHTTIEKLRQLAPAAIYNDNNLVVGRNEAVFNLQPL
ncbi:asparaginase [Paenibacillus alkaliterrae]|uniref:asparaginase n=1 Tax=Paenibacillus alkaliterrae TaxID=320909 RepID=UPI001F3ED1E4|nr:asparaginase [Paenibacillus alkaliterrae]MCF2936946.1 asparaginase [Paenibacillus alkaliterrae]